jgi:hypothetical protein
LGLLAGAWYAEIGKEKRENGEAARLESDLKFEISEG